jgi:hypothetical protein
MHSETELMLVWQYSRKNKMLGNGRKIADWAYGSAHMIANMQK